MRVAPLLVSKTVPFLREEIGLCGVNSWIESSDNSRSDPKFIRDQCVEFELLGRGQNLDGFLEGNDFAVVLDV